MSVPVAQKAVLSRVTYGSAMHRETHLLLAPSFSSGQPQRLFQVTLNLPCLAAMAAGGTRPTCSSPAWQSLQGISTPPLGRPTLKVFRRVRQACPSCGRYVHHSLHTFPGWPVLSLANACAIPKRTITQPAVQSPAVLDPPVTLLETDLIAAPHTKVVATNFVSHTQKAVNSQPHLLCDLAHH